MYHRLTVHALVVLLVAIVAKSAQRFAVVSAQCHKLLTAIFGLRAQLGRRRFERMLNLDHLTGKRKEGKLGTYAMERVAAGSQLPTPWLFKPAKRSDDRADYCLDCSFLHSVQTRGTLF